LNNEQENRHKGEIAMGRVFNFSAGPSMLPEFVLQRAAEEMLDYRGTGMSVMEMSHRSKLYLGIYEATVQRMRDVMGIPNNYKVLFLQGGATLQFASIPMHLMGRTGKADYAVTGSFAKKAMQEAKKYGEVNIACDSNPYAAIPAQSELTLDPNASYFHYCGNNTIFGTLWPYLPQTGDVPLVCDLSSSILSQPIDVSKYGVIYAGAQKNMGPAGLTVVIVRDDLLDGASEIVPSVMNWRGMADNDSMLNTPPSYGIYLLGLVLEWIETMGGLPAMETHNKKKAAVLYDAMDACDFYTPVADKGSRSLMNVTFRCPNEDLDKLFVKQAAEKDMLTLAGHRSAGGVRASIYNAMPMAGVETLAEFMGEFAKANG